MSEETKTVTKYTAFCQEAGDDGGTIWVEDVEAPSLEEAITTARAQCAKARDTVVDCIHVLGLTEPTKVLYWEDNY